MRLVPVDVTKLERLEAIAELSSQNALAEKAGIASKTVWNVKQRQAASLPVLTKVATALGVTPYELMPQAPSAQNVAATDEKHGRFLRRDRADQQDTKLVLTSKELSHRLLTGNLPTLAECLRATPGVYAGRR